MVVPPLKLASLTVRFKKKQNKKVKLWIVQCGQYSVTYFCLVLLYGAYYAINDTIVEGSSMF